MKNQAAQICAEAGAARITQAQAARIMGVSRRLVQYAAAIKDDPVLAPAVADGTLSVWDAWNTRGASQAAKVAVVQAKREGVIRGPVAKVAAILDKDAEFLAEMRKAGFDADAGA